MDASRQGARNRNAGHGYERDVANFLASELSLDIVTSRALSGGTAIGADIATVLKRDDGGRPVSTVATVHGWSVECKASTGPHKITEWMRQARSQSDSELYVVIAKNPRKLAAGSTVYLTGNALLWWLAKSPRDDARVRTIDIITWVDLLRADVVVADRD